MKKNTTVAQLLQGQQLLFVFLLTFAAIIVWIGSSIYFSYSKSTLTTQQQILVTPLNPKIETKAAETLSQRKWWTPEELSSSQQVQTTPPTGQTPVPSSSLPVSTTP